MIQPGKLYQNFIIRVYERGRKRRTVSERNLPKVVCPVHAIICFHRAETARKNQVKFTHKVAGFGRVVFYPVKSF
jgi:hypothetical protein